MKRILFFLPVFVLILSSFTIIVLAADSNPVPPFNLVNPLAGKPNSIPGLIGIVANFIFNIAIPISALIIIYGGFRMLTSGGVPANYQKGLDALKYAGLGLVVLLIAKGFVSLVQSILSLK